MDIDRNELTGRAVKLFTELTSIDSLSFEERLMADVLTHKLSELGFEVTEDEARKLTGGNAGNIYARRTGSGDAGIDRPAPVLFAAHMDTVAPGHGKKATLNTDGTITSDGTTILGADDVAGIVEILEGIRLAVELSRHSGRPLPEIEVIFSSAEEVFCRGIKEFDFSKIVSRCAFVPDLSGDIGTAANKAPSIITFTVKVTGRPAHAGFSPELGINAIAIASRAIAGLRQGRINDDTTFNIGTVSGGKATNIVSEECVLTGEVRSFDHEKALGILRDTEEAFRQQAESEGAAIGFEHTVHLKAYATDEDSEAVRRFRSACDAVGLSGDISPTLGGSDNHVLAEHGIEGLVISAAMYDVHSTHEYTKAEQLATGAELVSAIITG